MNGLLEWIIFLSLSAIAIITAAGMLLTMSMYRAGLALMTSFVALAGLFILLNADLLAAIQVMMNVGGMLVMVLFMVMIMMDPGGEMMWDMKRKMHLPGPGAFSMTMPHGKPPEEDIAQKKGGPETAKAADWICPMHPEVSELGPGTCPICGMSLIPRAEMGSDSSSQVPIYTCPMHPEVQQEEPGTCPKCGMDLVPMEEQQAHEHAGVHMEPSHHDKQSMQKVSMSPRQHYQMMVDMAMSTAQLPWAIVLGAASALLLIVLILQTPWPLTQGGPTQDATNAVGQLLLSRYMIGFEGAAYLILAGIAGAVIFAKRERKPAPKEMPTTVAVSGQVYTCPMHPEVREPQAGQCPICGMDLIPTEEAAGPASQSTQGDHI